MKAKITAATIAARIDAQSGQPSLTAVMAKPYPPTAMKPACPKFTRPVNPKQTASPRAASANAIVWGARICPMARMMKLKSMFCSSRS